MERSFKDSFKSVVDLGNTALDYVVKKLCGYSLFDRANKIWQETEQKWLTRLTRTQINLQRNIRRLEDKLYNKLCPKCGKIRLTNFHLKKHEIEAPDIITECQLINEQTKRKNGKLKNNKRPCLKELMSLRMRN